MFVKRILFVSIFLLFFVSDCFVISSPEWITFTPLKGCNQTYGIGYSLPVGQCINFEFSYWVIVQVEQINGEITVNTTNYNDPNCTEYINSNDYQVDQCLQIDEFYMDTTGSVSIGQNFPNEAVTYQFFYDSDNDCSGNNYYTFFTNNLEVNDIKYQCINGQPVVSSCYSSRHSDKCTVIPWGTQCVPGSQGGPGYYGCYIQ
ncbi:hypothetical protein PPL_04610 [Heterostelium album PN500]|uniref:Transmembrane protein n=1 Tax=Heterostelium pallidum (strain ATCC 26659 / Pp 5 / PN500) TaxID=670386 RepID=D3B820_HETP5|nr:hypothetical protein PPL_04610 [Heterostelium album PN500]EFA82188.1 hypothetical protein PPL_04610 [Heterostelium album PN500]|eukprot:XP_020434305.1 hypothetical protein PPL_04610 [Heterostelium album PN500]